MFIPLKYKELALLLLISIIIRRCKILRQINSMPERNHRLQFAGTMYSKTVKHTCNVMKNTLHSLLAILKKCQESNLPYFIDVSMCSLPAKSKKWHWFFTFLSCSSFYSCFLQVLETIEASTVHSIRVLIVVALNPKLISEAISISSCHVSSPYQSLFPCNDSPLTESISFLHQHYICLFHF